MIKLYSKRGRKSEKTNNQTKIEKIVNSQTPKRYQIQVGLWVSSTKTLNNSYGT